MSQNISIDLGQKYENLFGSHRTVREKFLILKGRITHKEGKTFFVDENGDGEELWKAIPYKILSPGTTWGLL